MIRQATATDIPAIAALEKELYSPQHYPELFLYQALQQWPSLVWVAERDELIAGYALGAPAEQPQQIWLMSLLVTTSAQGTGVGKTLLRQFLTNLKQQNYQQVHLTVAPDNFAALALYKKHGFTEVNEQADALGPGNHRLQLSCNL